MKCTCDEPIHGEVMPDTCITCLLPIPDMEMDDKNRP